MLKSRFLICCDTVIIDKKTNNISIVNTYDRFSGGTFPILIPRLTVIAVTEKVKENKDKHELKIQFKINKKELFSQNFKIDFRGVKINRFTLQFFGFAVPEIGKLSCFLYYKDKKLDNYEIDIEKSKSSPKIKQTT